MRTVITAVDSSVLLDVLTSSPAFGTASLNALREARGLGALVVCPIVWAEVRANFPDAPMMHKAFSAAGIQFDPFDQACADLAGDLWREYRRKGGKRERLVADFLIAAHAQIRAQQLLTRDRGFARYYFHQLRLVEPKT